MAKKTIKAQMKQRRDTKANWAATNPVLLDGELGIVSDDPNLYKVGDGATAWNDLPFRGFDGTLAQELGTSPNAVISQKIVSEKLTELESKGSDLSKGLYADIYSQLVDLSIGGFSSDVKNNKNNRARFNGLLTPPFEIETNVGYIIRQVTRWKKNTNGGLTYYDQVGINENTYNIIEYNENYLYSLVFSKEDDTLVINNDELSNIVKSFKGSGLYKDEQFYSFVENVKEELKEDISKYTSNVINSLMIEFGGMRGGLEEDVKNRCRNIGYIESPFDIEAAENYHVKAIYKYNKRDLSFVEYTTINKKECKVTEDDYLYRIVFSKVNDEESIEESDLPLVVSVFKNCNTTKISDIKIGVDVLGKAVVMHETESNLQKTTNGIYISYENGAYSINSKSTSWESWIIDAEGFIKLDATLGRSTALQCNVTFFKGKELVVDNIITHQKKVELVNNYTAINCHITDIPDDCTYIVVSNRIASLPEPTFSAIRVPSIWKEIKELEGELNEEKNSPITIPDVYITSQRRTKYATYNDLIAAYDELMSAHPYLMQKKELGLASDGQMLYEYYISSGNYNKEGLRGKDAEIEKPLVLIEAGIHGYEPESNTSLYIFVSDLVNGNLSLSKIRDNCTFKIIPCLNPYGYDHNRRGNANNVDLNRNFEVDWKLQGDVSVNPSYYGGPSAASEAETKIMQQWLRDNSNAVLFIDFHNSSYENEISCIGGDNDVDGMTNFKKKYLVGVHKLSSYLTSMLDIPDSSIWGYSYTSSLAGSSGKFRNSIGMVGGVLETSQNVNGEGNNSPVTIAVGADVLGTILLSCVDI